MKSSDDHFSLSDLAAAVLIAIVILAPLAAAGFGHNDDSKGIGWATAGQMPAR